MTQTNPKPDDKTAKKGRYNWRAEHRARSHENAHADIVEPVPPPGGPHPLVPRGKAAVIVTDDELLALIGRLRTAGSFAYDSEFIGELTYHPQLCLVQVASVHEVVLIDPMADLDLRPFWELLTEPAVEKIVHAGEQDVEPVVRHLDKVPANLFDTQIAAGLAAMPYPLSLSRLVNELTGARLGKGLTFTHWDQRPLSDMQLRYAADDVRYLPRVRAELGKRLDALGHAAWASEESAALCEPMRYKFDVERDFLRMRGAATLQPKNLAVLRALTAWREAAALVADVPPRSFLRDEILVDMARTPIKSADKFARVKGLPRPVEAEHGATIIAATQAALALPPLDLPITKPEEPSPTDKFRTDALWAAAQAIAAGRGIDAALVASRADLSDFYTRIRDGKGVEDLKLMRGWRREACGQPLLDLVEGRSGVGLSWSEGTLRAAFETAD